MSLTELPLEKAFMLVEPGPVLLVTTQENGSSNIMTITWHMVTDFTPRIAFATGPWNHSFRALRDTGECVLNVPGFDLAEIAVRIGDCSGAQLDKFARFGLTPLPGAEVRAPLIAECLGCLECRVESYLEDPGIFLLEGLRAWANDERPERRTFHARGDGVFFADGEMHSLRALMEDKLPPGV